MPQQADELLPFAGQGNREKAKYPDWLAVSKYADISRTVVVEGIKNKEYFGLVNRHLEKTCGDGDVSVVEQSDLVTQKDGRLFAFVRFKASTFIEKDAGKEELLGSKAAYDAVFEHQRNKVDLSDKLQDVHLCVRPAIYHGLLWVGELPENADDTLLEAVVTCLGLGSPQNYMLAWEPKNLCPLGGGIRKKQWGLVQFESDEVAAAALVSLWQNLPCTSKLPWPVILEPWAPMEGRSEKFLLRWKDLPIPPPHFVQHSSLEWDFVIEWRRMALQHHRQKEILRERQWKERHRLMKDMRPADEEEQWVFGMNDSRSPVSKLNATILVLDICIPTALSPEIQSPVPHDATGLKKVLMEFFSRFGEIDACHFKDWPSDRSAMILFRKASYAELAIKSFASEAVSPFGKITVQPYFIENTVVIRELDDEHIHNKTLKDAMEQFGAVSTSTIAMCQLTKQSRGWATVKYEESRSASDLLDILKEHFFVMTGSTRPIEVHPYAMGPLRWSCLSPAKELLNEESIRLLGRDDDMFDCALVARELQVKHRAEVRCLRQLQADERKQLERAQRHSLENEISKMKQLEMVQQTMERDSTREVQARGNEHSHKRLRGNCFRGTPGYVFGSFCGFAQKTDPFSGMESMWNGVLSLHITKAQMINFTDRNIWHPADFRFPAVVLGSQEVMPINQHIPWIHEHAVLGVLNKADAVKDIEAKRESTYFLMLSADPNELQPEGAKGIKKLRSFMHHYRKGCILLDDESTCGRLYLLDPSVGITMGVKGCDSESLLGALVLPSQGLPQTPFSSPSWT